jgi:hypothetical protein
MRHKLGTTLYEFAVDRVPELPLNHDCDSLVIFVAGHNTNPLFL